MSAELQVLVALIEAQVGRKGEGSGWSCGDEQDPKLLQNTRLMEQKYRWRDLIRVPSSELGLQK